MHPITIIGAGVTGLSCAWQCAKAGYPVTLIYKDEISTTASAHAAGLLKPFNATQTGYKQRLQQQSLWKYPQFIAELEKDSNQPVNYKPCGRLALYHSLKGWKGAQKAIRQTQVLWPKPQTEHSLDNLPNIHINTTTAVGALHCPLTATFNPSQFLKALYKACLRYGVIFKKEIFTPTQLHNIKTSHQQEAYIIATGAYTAPLLPQLHVKPIKKQALLLAWPYPTPLPYVVETGQIYCVPKPELNAVYIGATTEPEKGFCLEPTKEAALFLRNHAANLFPELTKAPILKHIVALQNKCVTPPPTKTSSLFLGHYKAKVFAAVGHGGVGFCLAPASAQNILTSIKATLK